MFEKFVDIFSRAGLIVGSMLLAIMMLLTVADVFMRYVFSAPISGSAEITQILLTLVVFTGFILVSRDGSHIVVSIFEPTISKFAPGMYGFIYAFANTLGNAFLLWVLYVAAREAFEWEDVTEGLEISFGWIISALTVFATLAFVAGFRVFTKGIGGHESAE